MLPKVALTDITGWDVAWPAATGLGLGLGARLLRHGYDLKTKRGLRPAKTPTPVEAAQIEVPVEVDENEAAELQRQGIKVALAAGTKLPPAQPVNTNLLVSGQQGLTTSPAPGTAPPAVAATPPTPAPQAPAPKKITTAAEGLGATLLQGSLLAGGAYGGWKALDTVLDEQRLNKAKASMQRSRDRVKRLIAGQPEDEELGAAHAIKVAEELYLEKRAEGIFGTAANIGGGVISDMAAPLGIPLGIGATMLAAKAYNEAKSNNKYRQRVKQISETLEKEEPMPSVAVLHPVRRHKAKNSPAEAGVLHNPGAEPADSPEIEGAKFAAHHDDDDSDMSTWIGLALAGLAGYMGWQWLCNNKEYAIQQAPWAKGIIEAITPDGPKPNAAAVAAAAPPKTGAAIQSGKPAPETPPAAAPAIENDPMPKTTPRLKPGTPEFKAEQQKIGDWQKRQQQRAVAKQPTTATPAQPAPPAPPAPATPPVQPGPATPPAPVTPPAVPASPPKEPTPVTPPPVRPPAKPVATPTAPVPPTLPPKPVVP